MMAHSHQVKAKALALLIVGNRVCHVARDIGVPKQTVSRWRAEADQILAECFLEEGQYPTLPALGRKMNFFGS
jgi:transposase-like protein